ncbi:hypothetical protein [Paenibacillus sp. YAF4_2]|uniref:hypothetical protein n=1 Tax=Paenibacillus sp. YAF4_2 TaxID=3233085 RepID=UPI003F9A33B3
MLKNVLIIFIMTLTLLGSSHVHANPDAAIHSEMTALIKSYEQDVGQRVLLPTWIPPKYTAKNLEYTAKDLSITYMIKQRHDGMIKLDARKDHPLMDKYTLNILLDNGKLAYFNGERSDGPFDSEYIGYVSLCFFDGNVLYDLHMHSRTIRFSKMKKIIVKVANSMEPIPEK